jgi:hypothetical protein
MLQKEYTDLGIRSIMTHLLAFSLVLKYGFTGVVR